MSPHSVSRLAILCLAALAVAACGDETAPTDPGPSARTLAWRTHVQPVLNDYCVGCHGGAEPEGSLTLEPYGELAEAPSMEMMRGKTELFERIAHHVGNAMMPPEGEPAPPDETKAAFTSWWAASIEEAWRTAPPNPGRVTMRRLNRYEYRRTVRDLLGVDFDTESFFPADDVGYGFDHIGDVLSMPPILFEKYLEAAERISEEAILVVDPNMPHVRRFEAEALAPAQQAGGPRGADYVLWSNGTIERRIVFPRTGFYILRARAHADQAGPEPARMALSVGYRLAAQPDVKAIRGAPQTYEVRVRVDAGKRRIAAAFVNDYYRPKHPDPKQRDRNLLIDWIEIEGPLAEGLGPMPESHRRIFTCDPVPGRERECAEEILGKLLARTFRRPPTADEVQRYAGLVVETIEAGEPFAGGIQTALQAALVSPQFLFRLELDERADPGGDTRPLTEHELASRLSYFLWSSMPDEALRELADAGRLRANLHDQVARMLEDERAASLVENFAGQWLELRRLEEAAPDPKRFKSFDDELRAAMQKETELFVAAIVREDRSILDLIDAPFTFLNEQLAKHYKIEGVTGKAFRRVKLSSRQRGGLLGHASILTLTSYPTRTSAVKRGKWLMEEILGTPPPPPPPGVGVLENQKPELLKLSLRERLAVHRQDPSCAICHDKLDNLGYGLENFDAVGAWRSKDGMARIDSAGVLPDGRSFDGPRELKQILKKDGGYPRCFAEKLLTYALGRGLEPYDRPAVMRIVDEAREKLYRFSSFVHAIVATDAFTMRRTSGDSP